jgi:hypothetical protein
MFVTAGEFSVKRDPPGIVSGVDVNVQLREFGFTRTRPTLEAARCLQRFLQLANEWKRVARLHAKEFNAMQEVLRREFWSA